MINDPNKEDQLDDHEFEHDMPDEEMDEMSDSDSVDFDDPYADDPSDSLDFDDMNDDFSDDIYEEKATGGSSLNWSNIIIFGFLALSVIGIGIFYVPRILGGVSNQNALQPQQAEAVQLQNGTAEDNQQLAEQAVGQNTTNQMAQSGGLLNNPELLNNTVDADATQGTKQEPGEEVFSDLDLFDLKAEQRTEQGMTDNNAEEITLNIEQPAYQDTIAQPLPVPSDAPTDSMGMQMSSDDEIIFEPLSPVEPSVAENEIFIEQPRIPTPTVQRQQDVIMADAPQNVALAEQVETLSNDMARLSAQLESFMNRTAEKAEQIEHRLSLVNTDTDSAAELQSLRSTIAKLEQRVADLQDQGTQQSQRSAPRQAQVSEPKAESSQRTQPTPSRQAVKPTPSRSPDWILRGASRGEAFIADPQSGTTRTVSVGDIVSGLGQVTAIAIENNRWVVRGTQGAVRQ